MCASSPRRNSRPYRGDIGVPAVSPYRDRPMEESLDLFRRMRAGEFPNGAMTLRAKIDLASGNFNMRDPVIYRINHMHHHRQGDKWCIYPMYDFAHPIQDALEGITHSLCSLEFEAHRPLYNWVIEHCELPAHPRQIEFARLGIDHTVMSKRKLRGLGGGGPGLRLGRSPYAHPVRPAPPGLHRRLHPQFLRAHRRGQVPQRGGVRLFGALPAGGSERHRPARHGRSAAREAHRYQLSRGPE